MPGLMHHCNCGNALPRPTNISWKAGLKTTLRKETNPGHLVQLGEEGCTGHTVVGAAAVEGYHGCVRSRSEGRANVLG